eukprot:NODE_7_length_67686_cov_1.621421.p42 type:complete len:186 gc:universal NODE_7_length_67686_cov_1.621421:49619-50176(+)
MRGGNSFGQRGGNRGFSRGGRGGSRGGRGGRQSFDRFQGNPMQPDNIEKLGSVSHTCEGQLIVKSENVRIPYFNAFVFTSTKQAMGKVDEILGPINQVLLSVTLQDGFVATSFKKGDEVYISDDKLLPLERFLPKPKEIKQKSAGGRGRGRGQRGGRGRGGPRGFSRGGNRGFSRGGRGNGRGRY